MLLPERLHKGDRVGIIAPAGPPNLMNLQKAISFFEAFDLKVQYGKHIDKVHGYLAGTDEERLCDFHDMVANPDIKAIFFARGGYGTARIAPYINYQLIKENPKIIWGYSDITYLHTAIRKHSNMITFHGPMAASDLGKEELDERTTFHMWKQLFEPAEVAYTENTFGGSYPLKVIQSGEVEGQLVGGNLSLLVSSIGTPFEIDTKGKLLFIEDIGEEPYRIDSMLNQLKLSGKLSEAAGIIIGDFANAESKLPSSFTVEEVFEDYFSHLCCPVMSGFMIGHCLPHFAIPLGVRAKLSTDNKMLVVEPGVR
ncbi:S66 peptidase family protein [Oceanobacillus bengalensis]|uniref:LD-carboxypeptidase n=1 Tax=Oceanobacillus bengalensis TaxID=1435466 RepID=A0A494YYP2_9BACI|nr:LD-carboxypeptidase [Oceanobacillus bengalensis]RKQ15349.1 LD-carboxypeptidase [Oceanobacillus bengalensis]